MKTRIATVALSSALLLSGTVLSHAEDIPENLKGSGEIVITSGGGSWEAAQKKAFFDPFTRDTGIKVVLVPEDHAKLLASVKFGQPEADLTSLPGGTLAGFVEKDALEKIDYSVFAKETLDQIPAKLRDEHGLGALLYSVGVSYNTTKFEKGSEPKNWADFYDIKKFPGSRSLPKCEKMVDGGLLEGALLADGVAADKLYPLDIDRAFAKVAEIKPHVGRWWIAGADAPQSLISGEVDIADAYNGRIFGAAKEGASLAFSWDQSLLQFDYWVVMKGSPNKENAEKFMAYISRPEPQAVFAEAISYGPVNEKAFGLLSKDLLEVLPGSPVVVEKQVFQDYAWWNSKNAEGRTNWDVALERCVALLSQ